MKYRETRTSLSHGSRETNDGMDLGDLAAGAVVVASHVGGFYGVDFQTFLLRLLYELGVRPTLNEPVGVPEDYEFPDMTIPFLYLLMRLGPVSFWGC